MNVFDFALQMEEDGKRYYEKLAAEASHTGLKRIFAMLADVEREHHDVFQTLKSGASAARADSRVLDRAKNIFQEMMAEKGALKTIKTDLDAYRHALKLEAESVRLYEEMAAKEKNEEVRELLQKIAEEEKHHYNIVENIHDFVAAPETYLAWGEFSNLREF